MTLPANIVLWSTIRMPSSALARWITTWVSACTLRHGAILTHSLTGGSLALSWCLVFRVAWYLSRFHKDSHSLSLCEGHTLSQHNNLMWLLSLLISLIFVIFPSSPVCCSPIGLSGSCTHTASPPAWLSCTTLMPVRPRYVCCPASSQFL